MGAFGFREPKANERYSDAGVRSCGVSFEIFFKKWKGEERFLTACCLPSGRLPPWDSFGGGCGVPNRSGSVALLFRLAATAAATELCRGHCLEASLFDFLSASHASPVFADVEPLEGRLQSDELLSVSVNEVDGDRLFVAGGRNLSLILER